MPNETTPRTRWWHRLPTRLSVRGLIVLVLVIGGGLGWITHQARVQRQAVAAIEAAGGSVQYDWEWWDSTSEPFFSKSKKAWPKWLVNALGIDILSSVSQVRFPDVGSRADDQIMAEIGRLSNLKQLEMSKSRGVTDAGLVHLKWLSRLKILNLCLTGVKGPGLVHLAGLTELQELNLGAIPIHDADLVHLSTLHRIDELILQSPHLTDAGLVHLKGLNPETLILADGPITSSGLVHLLGMSRLNDLALSYTKVETLEPIRSMIGLEALDLSRSPITEEGFASLKHFPRLRILSLERLPIDDAGLARIPGLNRLTILNLDGTRITDASIPFLARLTTYKEITVWNSRMTKSRESEFEEDDAHRDRELISRP